VRHVSLVPISIDHVAVPVRNPENAARFLGELLGLEVVTDGPEGEFRSLRLDGGAALLFTPADAPIVSHHLALRVGPREFDAVVLRLRQRAIVFGNDPEERTNGGTDDPLGGYGRVYFIDPEGHFFEVCA
jgi:catechol 2,3-dioxygenase-like lactoylglutathione lyase family enzyme